jgi:hypothetical protein
MQNASLVPKHYAIPAILQKEKYALLSIFNKIQTSLKAANRPTLKDRMSDHA